MSWPSQVVRSLHRAGVAMWERLRPHTGACAVAAVYLVAVYLIGHR